MTCLGEKQHSFALGFTSFNMFNHCHNFASLQKHLGIESEFMEFL